MRDDSQKISRAEFTYIMDTLEKWIDQPLDLTKGHDGKYEFSAKVDNSDFLNLKFIVVKRGLDNSYFGFALLCDNHRIKGIDWRTRQRLDDGKIIENCYHCNDWNAESQSADQHLYNDEIHSQLTRLDNENAIRFVLKKWNIRCVALEQLRLTGI